MHNLINTYFFNIYNKNVYVNKMIYLCKQKMYKVIFLISKNIQLFLKKFHSLELDRQTEVEDCLELLEGRNKSEPLRR